MNNVPFDVTEADMKVRDVDSSNPTEVKAFNEMKEYFMKALVYWKMPTDGWVFKVSTKTGSATDAIGRRVMFGTEHLLQAPQALRRSVAIHEGTHVIHELIHRRDPFIDMAAYTFYSHDKEFRGDEIQAIKDILGFTAIYPEGIPKTWGDLYFDQLLDKDGKVLYDKQLFLQMLRDQKAA